MNALLGFICFFAVALIGWAIAELKGKADNYVENTDEQKAMQTFLDNQRKGGYEEMSIHDVVKSISTKGFSAL